MRTTLSLDDDVAALLARVQKARKTSFKEVVNFALREGLTKMIAPQPPRARFQTQAVSLGNCLLSNLDDISDALASAEGEAYR